MLVSYLYHIALTEDIQELVRKHYVEKLNIPYILPDPPEEPEEKEKKEEAKKVDNKK